MYGTLWELKEGVEEVCDDKDEKESGEDEGEIGEG